MSSERKKVKSLRNTMITTNILIALLAFTLCGVLFIISASTLTKDYISSDMDFYMEQITGNIDQRTKFIEDAMISVRNTSDLMDAVAKDDNSGDRNQLQNRFQNVVDISSENNISENGTPFITCVFLMCSADNYLTSFYYAPDKTELGRTDRDISVFYNNYLESGETAYRESLDGKTYLAYPLYDSNMDAVSCMIFRMNTDSIKEVMSTIERFDDAFFVMYDKYGPALGTDNINADETIAEFSGEHSDDPYIKKIGNKKYRVYNTESNMGFDLLMGIPESYAASVLMNSFKVYLFVIVIAGAISLISFAVFTSRVTKPLEQLTAKLRKVETGDYTVKLDLYDSEEFTEISNAFNEMTDNINHLVHEVYEKKIAIDDMNLRFYQSQMNPHFVFNVLNGIALQAKMDGNDSLFQVTSSFAKLMQAKIYRSDSEKVMIKQELEYVKCYLEIQEFRYGDKLNCTFKVDNDRLLDYYVPKLCIQLIVENAVVHGIENKIADGVITVRIADDDGIMIIVEDNGVGFDRDGEIPLPLVFDEQAEGHNHIGINNVLQIIKLAYGDKYGMRIISKKNVGTTVMMHIPYDNGSTKQGDD